MNAWRTNTSRTRSGADLADPTRRHSQVFAAASCGPGLVARSGQARWPTRSEIPIRVAQLRLAAATITTALARTHRPKAIAAVAAAVAVAVAVAGYEG